MPYASHGYPTSATKEQIEAERSLTRELLVEKREYVIVSRAGSFWTGVSWTSDADLALRFDTEQAADEVLPVVIANNPHSYIVYMCVVD